MPSCGTTPHIRTRVALTSWCRSRGRGSSVELSEASTNPDTLLRVANLTVPLKPVGASRTHPDPFKGPAALARALGLARVERAQIESLRILHAVVVDLVDRVVAGQPVAGQTEQLTAL